MPLDDSGTRLRVHRITSPYGPIGPSRSAALRVLIHPNPQGLNGRREGRSRPVALEDSRFPGRRPAPLAFADSGACPRCSVADARAPRRGPRGTGAFLARSRRSGRIARFAPLPFLFCSTRTADLNMVILVGIILLWLCISVPFFASSDVLRIWAIFMTSQESIVQRPHSVKLKFAKVTHLDGDPIVGWYVWPHAGSQSPCR